MKYVDRDTFVQFCQDNKLVSKLVEGTTISVTQWFDSEGNLRAQAIYRPGSSCFAIL